MILKVAVPRFRGPCLTPICASARPARCSANIPTLAEVQPSVRRSLDRLLEGQVIDDATSSPRNCKSGRTTTTTTALTALLAAKHLRRVRQKAQDRCHRPSSVAQSDERAHRAIK
jgi:hypothetical protein